MDSSLIILICLLPLLLYLAFHLIILAGKLVKIFFSILALLSPFILLHYLDKAGIITNEGMKIFGIFLIVIYAITWICSKADNAIDKRQRNHVSIEKKGDELFFKVALNELLNSPDQGFLAKCMVKADGDHDKAQALYIRHRVSELKTTETIHSLNKKYLNQIDDITYDNEDNNN